MNTNVELNTASVEEIKAEAVANPDMVVPAEVKEEAMAMSNDAVIDNGVTKLKSTVEKEKKMKKVKEVNPLDIIPTNPLKSTNVVDHLLNGSCICPADVSSNGLKKDFWRQLVESFGCLYTSPLKPAAQIVLVTPKDNSIKFEKALKSGMNCVEYPVAVKDLRESTNEKVMEFLAGNEEWQNMLKREAEVAERKHKTEVERAQRAERTAKRMAEKAAKAAEEAKKVLSVSLNDVEVPAEAKEVASEEVEETQVVTEESANETSVEVTD